MRPPEIRFTPPTPNELAANVLLQTPAKQGTHSIFGAEQQGFKNLGAEGSNGPSSVTLSTNFNPFSPMRPRAPGESHKMKAGTISVVSVLSCFLPSLPPRFLPISRFEPPFALPQRVRDGRGAWPWKLRCSL